MALPEVKFQVVAEGIPQAINSLRNLQQTILNHEAAVIEIKKAGIRRIREEQARGYNQEIADLKRHMANMNQVRQTSMSPNVGGNFGIGTRFSGGGSNIGASMGGMGGLIGGAIQASKDVPLSPMWMLGKWKDVLGEGADLIKQGIQSIFDAMKFGATEIAGAMLDLGQAKSIRESIVMAGKTETLATTNVFETAPADRGGLTPGQNLKDIQAMSRGTTFNVQDIAKAQQAWERYHGKIREFKDTFDLINKLSLVTNRSLEDTARDMAQLRQEFSGMSDADFRRLYSGISGQARAGGVPQTELGSLNPAFAMIPALGGDDVDNALMVSAIAQQVAPAFKRGGSARGGGAGVSTAIKDLIADVAGGKLTGLGMHVKGGVIQDPEKLFPALAVASRHAGAPGLKLSKPELELGEILRGQAEQKIGKGATDEQLRAEVTKNIEAMEKNAFTQKELNEAYETIMDTVENQLKKAFVELSNYIGNHVLPWIRANLMPSFEKIKDWLEKNSTNFGSLYDNVSKTVVALGDLAEKLGHVLLEIAKVFYKNLISPMIDASLLYIEGLGKLLGTNPLTAGIGKDLIDIVTGVRGGKKDIENIISTPFGGGPKKLESTAPTTAEIQTVHISDKSQKELAREIHNNMNVHNPFRRHWEPIGSGRTGS